GMTTSLTDAFGKGVRDVLPKASIREISLLDAKVEHCKGCYECIKTKGRVGTCSIDDDVNPLLREMAQADGIVYATPVYMLGPTALMKRFMERNYPILDMSAGMPKGRMKRKNRLGGVIVSKGAPNPINRLFGITYYPVKILKWLCKLFGCKRTMVFRAGGMEANEKSKQKCVDKARLFGRRFGRALKHNLYK
ncbi:MAG: flavodoxin family protein, partial [Nanobdellota archaeon]